MSGWFNEMFISIWKIAGARGNKDVLKEAYWPESLAVAIFPLESCICGIWICWNRRKYILDNISQILEPVFLNTGVKESIMT